MSTVGDQALASGVVPREPEGVAKVVAGVPFETMKRDEERPEAGVIPLITQGHEELIGLRRVIEAGKKEHNVGSILLQLSILQTPFL